MFPHSLFTLIINKDSRLSCASPTTTCAYLLSVSLAQDYTKADFSATPLERAALFLQLQPNSKSMYCNCFIHVSCTVTGAIPCCYKDVPSSHLQMT